MKKGEIYSGKVKSIDFPNKGRVLVEKDNEVENVFVKNVIPGQTVDFMINKKKNGLMQHHIIQGH